MQLTTQIRLTGFFAKFPVRQYSRGQILYHPEDPVDKVILMHSGRVRQYQITDEGNDIVVNIFRGTSLFPLTTILSKSVNNYFYEASDDIKVRIAPIDELRAFFNKNPEIVYDLLSITHQAMESMMQRMTYAMGSNAYNRLLYELINECNQSKTSKPQEVIKLKLHEYELAEQTGLSRETTNRVLKKLKAKGWVSVSRKFITINKFKPLKNELGTKI